MIHGSATHQAEHTSHEHGGFSQARLGRMHGVMAGHVERGGMPGLVTLVCRDQGCGPASRRMWQQAGPSARGV